MVDKSVNVDYWTASKCQDEYDRLAKQFGADVLRKAVRLTYKGYSLNKHEIDPEVSKQLSLEQRYVIINDWHNYGARVRDNEVTIYTN